MNSRRSFFKRLAAIAAVVALAPEIAFGTRLKTAPLDFDQIFHTCYELTRARSYCSDKYIDILTDRATAEAIRRAMINFWEHNA